MLLYSHDTAGEGVPWSSSLLRRRVCVYSDCVSGYQIFSKASGALRRPQTGYPNPLLGVRLQCAGRLANPLASWTSHLTTRRPIRGIRVPPNSAACSFAGMLTKFDFVCCGTTRVYSRTPGFLRFYKATRLFHHPLNLNPLDPALQPCCLAGKSPPGLPETLRRGAVNFSPVAAVLLLGRLLRVMFDFKLPAIVVALTAIASVPAFYMLRLVAHRRRVRRAAKRAGAVLPPEWNGEKFGNRDLLVRAIERFQNGYIGRCCV